MKSPSRAERRSADQWREIVKQFKKSGLSAVRFCQEQDLGYASFCQWRRRLAEDNPVTELKGEPAFVDVSALTAGGVGAWQIVLSLGGGVELRVSGG